ncbi:hypothetical protein M436DRAFT_49156 [Aureobasidium namibiae CBS 147.97]|uniref:Uncharacterized protein n=1 Tax=Aureobasidium namibiae CBS 147.97 TaxID=1043004 RepID=A0A074WGI9_9PEZI
MGLSALCCTAEISLKRISSFLEQTYENSSKMDCQPSLKLISSLEDLEMTTHPIVTAPPVHPFTSPFLSRSPAEVAEILAARTSSDSMIESNLFAILDEKSLSEDSGLIVQVKAGRVESVRVHLDTINAELIRVKMITFDVKETQGLVGKDGVFRTKPPDESKKGGSAVRKKLGQVVIG